MNKIILGLVGKIASGKSIVSQYLQEKYQAKIISYSEPLREILTILSQEINRQNLVNLSIALRKTFGQECLANAIKNRLEKTESNIIILDGIRRASDIFFSHELPNFYLLFVDADPEVRFKRLTARNQNADDQTKTYEEFLKDEQNETESLINELAQSADYKLINNDEIEKLYQQIDKIIAAIKI